MSDMALSRIIGDSARMRELRALVAHVAPVHIPVLIQGPTGAGKELVAQALHSLSGRRGRFVAINVCALADSMFEAALFGHTRGAFTGALGDLPGYLVEADGGTLLFDEIGGLPLPQQAKLLRAIELGEFRPVGARADRRSDFRVLAATNQPLEQLTAAGQFRADLQHRLAGLVLVVPALRERVDDIPELARHFASALRAARDVRFSASVLSALQEYGWPGNVRELRRVIERAVILSDSATLHRHDIFAAIAVRQPQPVFDGNGSVCRERQELLTLLESCLWDTAEAARRLGVSRSTVYRRMERLAVNRREQPPSYLPHAIPA